MNTLESILDTKGRSLHVIPPDATVLEAVEAMCRAHVGALLVMEEGQKLSGVFSERDLMMRVVLKGRDASRIPVREVMTRELVCVEPNTAPRQAMALMTDHRVRHLPVVEGKRVVGLVSIGDLVRWTIRDREREVEQLHEYISGRYPG